MGSARKVRKTGGATLDHATYTRADLLIDKQTRNAGCILSTALRTAFILKEKQVRHYTIRTIYLMHESRADMPAEC